MLTPVESTQGMLIRGPTHGHEASWHIYTISTCVHAGVVQEHACAMRHSLAQYHRQANSATESKLHEHVFQAFQLKAVQLRIGASPDATEFVDALQQPGSPASADSSAHMFATLLVSCSS